MHIVARAPNHLGDAVMALPAMEALAARARRLTILAPSWAEVLYEGIGDLVEPGPVKHGDAAVLFAPSLRAALETRRLPRRVGTPTDWRSWLLTDRVAERVHRRDTYAAIARVLGAEVTGGPRLDLSGSAPPLPMGHLGLVPVSPSGAPVEWWGYRVLADRARRPVVFYGGPGEEDRVRAIAGPHPCCVGLPLPDFAEALKGCSVLVGNDSGASHFARALGVPVVVPFGSTSPERTGPHGAFAVEGPALACRPCYRKSCAHGLECLNIPVERVQQAIEKVAR